MPRRLGGAFLVVHKKCHELLANQSYLVGRSILHETNRESSCFGHLLILMAIVICRLFLTIANDIPYHVIVDRR